MRWECFGFYIYESLIITPNPVASRNITLRVSAARRSRSSDRNNREKEREVRECVTVVNLMKTLGKVSS